MLKACLVTLDPNRETAQVAWALAGARGKVTRSEAASFRQGLLSRCKNVACLHRFQREGLAEPDTSDKGEGWGEKGDAGGWGDEGDAGDKGVEGKGAAGTIGEDHHGKPQCTCSADDKSGCKYDPKNDVSYAKMLGLSEKVGMQLSPRSAFCFVQIKLGCDEFFCNPFNGVSKDCINECNAAAERQSGFIGIVAAVPGSRAAEYADDWFLVLVEHFEDALDKGMRVGQSEIFIAGRSVGFLDAVRAERHSPATLRLYVTAIAVSEKTPDPEPRAIPDSALGSPARAGQRWRFKASKGKGGGPESLPEVPPGKTPDGECRCDSAVVAGVTFPTTTCGNVARARCRNSPSERYADTAYVRLACVADDDPASGSWNPGSWDPAECVSGDLAELAANLQAADPLSGQGGAPPRMFVSLRHLERLAREFHHLGWRDVDNFGIWLSWLYRATDAYEMLASEAPEDALPRLFCMLDSLLRVPEAIVERSREKTADSDLFVSLRLRLVIEHVLDGPDKPAAAECSRDCQDEFVFSCVRVKGYDFCRDRLTLKLGSDPHLERAGCEPGCEFTPRMLEAESGPCSAECEGWFLSECLNHEPYTACVDLINDGVDVWTGKDEHAIAGVLKVGFDFQKLWFSRRKVKATCEQGCGLTSRMRAARTRADVNYALGAGIESASGLISRFVAASREHARDRADPGKKALLVVLHPEVRKAEFVVDKLGPPTTHAAATLPVELLLPGRDDVFAPEAVERAELLSAAIDALAANEAEIQERVNEAYHRITNRKARLALAVENVTTQSWAPYALLFEFHVTALASLLRVNSPQTVRSSQLWARAQSVTCELLGGSDETVRSFPDALPAQSFTCPRPLLDPSKAPQQILGSVATRGDVSSRPRSGTKVSTTDAPRPPPPKTFRPGSGTRRGTTAAPALPGPKRPTTGGTRPGPGTERSTTRVAVSPRPPKLEIPLRNGVVRFGSTVVEQLCQNRVLQHVYSPAAMASDGDGSGTAGASNGTIGLAMIAYEDGHIFTSAGANSSVPRNTRLLRVGSNDSVAAEVQSRVVSVSLGEQLPYPNGPRLDPPVEVDFRISAAGINGSASGGAAECAFYSFGTQQWMTDGCTTKVTSGGADGMLDVTCACTHMTNFAVLFSWDGSASNNPAPPPQPPASAIPTLPRPPLAPVLVNNSGGANGSGVVRTRHTVVMTLSILYDAVPSEALGVLAADMRSELHLLTPTFSVVRVELIAEQPGGSGRVVAVAVYGDGVNATHASVAAAMINAAAASGTLRFTAGGQHATIVGAAIAGLLADSLSYAYPTHSPDSGTESGSGTDLIASEPGFGASSNSGDTLASAHITALEVITFLGLGVSVVSFGAVLVTYLVHPSLMTRQKAFLCHICGTLLVGESCFVSGVFVADSTEEAAPCTVMGLLTHFALLSGFFWTLVDAVYIHGLFYRPLDMYSTADRPMAQYLLFCYGVPAVIVLGTALGVDAVYVRDPDQCSLTHEGGAIWALVGPGLLIISTNTVVFVRILRKVLSVDVFEQPGLSPEENARRSRRIKAKRAFKASGTFFSLFSVGWIFGGLTARSIAGDAWLTFAYIFCIMLLLQGLCIFVFQLYWDPKVGAAWQETLRRKRSLQMVRSNKGYDPGSNSEASDVPMTAWTRPSFPSTDRESTDHSKWGSVGAASVHSF